MYNTMRSIHFPLPTKILKDVFSVCKAAKIIYISRVATRCDMAHDIE